MAKHLAHRLNRHILFKRDERCKEGNSRIKWLYGSVVSGIVEAAFYKEDWRTKLWRAWHLLPEPKRIDNTSTDIKYNAEFDKKI